MYELENSYFPVFRQYFLSLFLLLILVLSCEKDKLRVIEDDFLIYYDNFIQEANSRGIDIEDEMSLVSIRFGDIEMSNISGNCNRSTKLITVDSVWWNRLRYEEKEHLIFHELGHCVLDRGHHDEFTECLTCYSFMRSNSNLCSINHYSMSWRTHYLNELFNIPDSTDQYLLDCGINNEEEDRIALLDTTLIGSSFESVEYEIDHSKSYELEIEYIDWIGHPSMLLDYNSLRFDFNPARDLTIYELDANNQEWLTASSKIFYFHRNIDLLNWSPSLSSIFLGIKKIDGNHFFYLNKKLVHVMEDMNEELVVFRSGGNEEGETIKLKFYEIE